MTMVVPFAAGSSSDIVGRVVASRLSEVLGQQVIIENIGGAGGMTGANRVAKAEPDGYQFVLGTGGTHATNQTLYKKPLYNAATDFAPVALVVEQKIVLVSRKNLQVDNLKEFAAYAKANQDKMQYGSPGTGSAPHLACALLNAALGINITHVPYRGAPPAIQDLIAGRIDYACLSGTAAIPQIESQTVKALAILTKDRSPSFPSLSSAHEQGLPDFHASTWYAIFLPRSTPASIVRKLHGAVMATMNTPAVQERLKEIGTDLVAPERRSPEYLAKFVVSEIDRWAAAIKTAGVSAD
ncbi:MAG TPA: tripartite tricarboxylate transporter substrate-binding protein [Xanthobacteraceae bacterium]|jgi:tripartite-type tricarboxylate transporter receptor subunit TctC|nr:tripartite tricarboxylate transporter substrate-binding protein [Xanthobacteraceae bacterium]